jgi:hypothetical protein
MAISLFIRSYENDFEWLKYSIKSIIKNMIGVDETVLVIPDTTSHVPEEFKNFFDRIFMTQEKHTGYIAQQVTKVNAFKYCLHENILFSDSDCIYYNKFDARDYLDTDRTILLSTPYSSLSGDVLAWRGITHAATGILPDKEYMRQFPIMHKSHVCEALSNSPIYNNYISAVIGHHLSEFNALGIIAETQYLNDYRIIDTTAYDKPFPPSAKQYWSWGGITEAIRKELETI